MKKRILALLATVILVSGVGVAQEEDNYKPPSWSIKAEDSSLQTISRRFLMNNPQSWLVNARPIKGESEIKWLGDVSIPKYSEINEKNVEFASWNFIKNYRDLLQIEPDQLEIQYSDFLGGEWVVSFGQHYKGIPVYGGRLDLKILPKGKIKILSNYYKKKVELDTDPNIRPKRAIKEALESLAFSSKAKKIYKNGLVIYPLLKDKKYHYELSWWFEIVTESPKGRWEFIVDAHSGKILKKEDRSALQTTMK